MGKSQVSLTRRQELVKFLQFVAFSISAGAVQILVSTLLHEVIGIKGYWPAYLPALIMSVLWNFTVNRRFTFKSVSNIPLAMMKVTIYYLFFTPLSTFWGDKLNNMDMGINKDAQFYIILLGTMVINFVTEFCVYRFWVYRTTLNTSEAGQREQERIEQQYNKE